MTPHVTAELLTAILDGHALHPFGLHGVGHWARVLENGVRIAEAEGGDVDVVRLFAVLHDARRFDDGDDPEHGSRGADLARTLRGQLFDLPDPAFDRLVTACELHTHERTHDDLTVRCCFDADRLDLGRVGVWPDVRYLGTETGRSESLRAWALERSQRDVVPDFVALDWGVSVDGSFRQDG